ncbi:MAG: low specificity L-threonine aldolase [Pseudomonadota bacterium]
MNFGSDNTAGIAPQILDAIAEANAGQTSAYGGDPLTAEVSDMFSTFFERDVHVTLVTLGTAANALALSAITPPWGAVLCHHEAHINVDECGAPEMYSGGAKIVGVDGPGAKIDPIALKTTLERVGPLRPHHVKPAALSLSQVTEAGRVYRVQEIEELADIAHGHGLKVHMDGARFANALVSLNTSPADVTWKAGVDVLCFGATKAGAMAAEAIICFDEEIGENMDYRRKRAAHLWSKHRFLAAQWKGFLDDDHWRDLARHANAMAATLAQGIVSRGIGRLPFEADANEVFAVIGTERAERAQSAGAVFYPWSTHGLQLRDGPGKDEGYYRFVTSFATSQADVNGVLNLLAG